MPGLVRYGDGVGVGEANRIVLPSSVDLYDDDGQLVGYAKSIARADERNVERQRHLSSSDAGRVIEQTPLPENVTITVSGFSLYNKTDLTGKIPHYSLAARLSKGTGAQGGFGGDYLFKSINSQKIPFNMRKVVIHPATAASSVVWFRGCMLTRYSETSNIGEATETSEATIQVSWVDESQAAGSSPGGTVIG